MNERQRQQTPVQAINQMLSSAKRKRRDAQLRLLEIPSDETALEILAVQTAVVEELKKDRKALLQQQISMGISAPLGRPLRHQKLSAVPKRYDAKWRQLIGYTPRKKLWNDIRTCPICSVNKPDEERTGRELAHMERHFATVSQWQTAGLPSSKPEFDSQRPHPTVESTP